jgi:hypothetical protein
METSIASINSAISFYPFVIFSAKMLDFTNCDKPATFLAQSTSKRQSMSTFRNSGATSWPTFLACPGYSRRVSMSSTRNLI